MVRVGGVKRDSASDNGSSTGLTKVLYSQYKKENEKKEGASEGTIGSLDKKEGASEGTIGSLDKRKGS